MVSEPFADRLHRHGFRIEFTAIEKQTANRRKSMPGLGRIGDTLYRAVGKHQTRRTLHMNEKQIDLRSCPGNLKAPALQIPFVDLPAVGKIGNTVFILPAESIGRIETGRTIGVVDIHQLRRPAVNRITPDVVGLG